MVFYDPDKVARACRMSIAARMITQGEISEQTGIPRAHLNSFLRRKLNLLDCDMEKLMDALELCQSVKEKLSINVTVPVDILV